MFARFLRSRQYFFGILFTICFLPTVNGFSQIQSGLEYDVYFLAGQSNATGRGDAAELPQIDQGVFVSPQADVQFFYRSTLTRNGQINTNLMEDQFVNLQAGSGHGFNNPGSHVTEFGPELSLGRTLAGANPDRNIAIIKYSHGGSNLHTDWDVGGSRYTEMVDVSSDALDALTATGALFDLRGLAWVQGESDTSNANAANYEANLTDLIRRFRTDLFDGQQAPIVVTRLSDNQYNNLTAGTLAVRAAQVAVAEADLRVEWVDADGAEFSTYDINNPIHFDANGTIALGSAIGNAFLSQTIPEPSSGNLVMLLLLRFIARRRR